MARRAGQFVLVAGDIVSPALIFGQRDSARFSGTLAIGDEIFSPAL